MKTPHFNPNSKVENHETHGIHEKRSRWGTHRVGRKGSGHRRPWSPVLIVLASLMLSALPLRAQWLTQTIGLKQGWNAVYLHVDASYETLHNLVGAGALIPTPIAEVWMWIPPSAGMQYVQTPQAPLDTGSQWASWKKAAGTTSALQRLVGNAAFLVYATTDFSWTVKGRPVPPNYQWTVSGLNFLGFPIAPASAPSLEDFLNPAPDLRLDAEIFQYPGGELGDNNPARIIAYRSTFVRRGQAFWMRATNVYNRYFGPFEITAVSAGGLKFDRTLGSASLRLRNLTTSDLTVTLKLAASEPPPAGQPAIAGAPPLLVRGSLNPTNLTHGYSNLPAGTPRSWVLAGQGQPGSETEVVIGLNRAAITAAPGELLAGILSFTDSLGFSQVDVPVSATVASAAGLWVGGAVVTQVGQYLKAFQTDTNGVLVTSTSTNDFGAYITTNIDTSLGDVPRFFPLRLIVHNPTNGGAVLLQRVYVGQDAYTNQVVATREAVLNRALLAEARRISVTHLPWTENNDGWTFSGLLGPAANVSATVRLDYADQQSNPFLHTYHPDHDNLDATFKTPLLQGVESYTIVRNITLAVTPPADDFASLTAAGQQLGGTYAETIEVLGLVRQVGSTNTPDTREFEVRGAFTLNRINDVPTLTKTP